MILLFNVINSYASNVDRLINEFKKNEFVKNDSVLFNLSYQISLNSNNPEEKLNYAQKSIFYSTRWGKTKKIAAAKYLEANAYKRLGDYLLAIKSF